MLVENLSISSALLSLASGVVKIISGVVLTTTDNNRKSYYRNSTIEVYNGSGNTIHFLPLSDNEYTLWNGDQGFSSYIPVLDSTIKEVTDLRDGITRIICKGSSGHTSGVTFTIMKERW